MLENFCFRHTENHSNDFHYGKISVPVGRGENVKVGTTTLLGKKVNIVRWTGKEKKVEYWECEKCNSEED